MKKISVKLCVGTTCFVMGGGGLLELEEIILEKYGDRVSFVGQSCLDLCSKSAEYAKAPFVKVDDEIIAEATIEKVLETIDNKLGVK